MPGEFEVYVRTVRACNRYCRLLLVAAITMSDASYDFAHLQQLVRFCVRPSRSQRKKIDLGRFWVGEGN